MSKNPKNKTERDPVGSLVRVLSAILESDKDAVGVREIARELGVAPSSVQRTLESGARNSLVSPTQGGKWAVGWEMFRLSSYVTRGNPFAACQEHLDRLAAELGETVVLTVLDIEKNLRMFVASSDSKWAVRFVPELYVWLPALAGATGLAIVANLPQHIRTLVYERTPPNSRPERLKTIQDFETECAKIRENSFAFSSNEVDLGASAIAKYIDTETELLCAVGVIIPQQRYQSPNESDLRVISATATSIAELLGKGQRHKSSQSP